MGDIAMTVPVLYSFAKRYPEHEVTLLSRKMVAPLFANMPANIHFKGISLDDYPGIIGLYRLFRELNSSSFDAVADLHNVLRTMFLRGLFKMHGVPTAYIDKGRRERHDLVRCQHKKLVQLTSSTERYALVFDRLGYSFPMCFTSVFADTDAPLTGLLPITGEKGTCRWFGIAPFAAHKGKIYPLSLMQKVISLLHDDERNRIFLFGAGPQEKKQCEEWAKLYNRVTSLVGCFGMGEELALMSHLDVMVTMDSANMHLASLVHTPVVSVWGATHPYAGFCGMQAPRSRIIQADLACRPCSIYGNKKCVRRDYACLSTIMPKQIVDAVYGVCGRKETVS